MLSCVKHLKESQTQLKTNGLKVTSARLGLLDVFKHAKKPVSVKQLAKKLGKNAADVVTLYRNVEALADLGVLKMVRLNDKQIYYELAGGEHHHHLICTNCGKLEDVKMREINLSKTFLKSHGFAKVTSHSLEFFGLCQACVKK